MQKHCSSFAIQLQQHMLIRPSTYFQHSSGSGASVSPVAVCRLGITPADGSAS
jgi:hypothetical protein